MQCPDCEGPAVKADAGWYCPACDSFVDPTVRPQLKKPAQRGLSQPENPMRRIFGFIALGTPLLFITLPQASCTGISSGSFTGLALIQTFVGSGGGYEAGMIRDAVGGLVIFAIFALTLACLLAGIIGLLSLKTPLVPTAFSTIGIMGLVASLLGLVARGDQSLQGLNVRLEIGFYLILSAFLLMFLAPGIERGLGKLFSQDSESVKSQLQQKE